MTPRDGTALGVSAILVGLASTAAMLLFGPAFYAALGATGPALEAAVLYSDVLFLGAVPSWMFNAAASVLRGRQHGVPGRRGRRRGRGHAGGLPARHLRSGPGPRARGRRGGLGRRRLQRGNVGRAPACRVGVRLTDESRLPFARAAVELRFWDPALAVPSAASTVLTNLTFIILTALVARFGTEATARYGAAGRLEYMLIPVVFGVGSALVPLVAASDGAGDIGRIRRLTRAGAALGAGACGLVGFTAALFPSAWMALFTSDPAVAGLGGPYLVWVGPAYAFLGLGLALYFAAQRRGRTAQPLLATLTRCWSPGRWVP